MLHYLYFCNILHELLVYVSFVIGLNLQTAIKAAICHFFATRGRIFLKQQQRWSLMTLWRRVHYC